MSKLTPYIGIARGNFLVLPVTLVLCGVGAAAYEGEASWLRSILALVGLVAAHTGVNALNEWSDMRTEIDLHTNRTPFSGGSGTLPAGEGTLKMAFRLGAWASAVALVVGLWFLWAVGWVFLPFLLVGAFFITGYTDLLARLGLGEVAAGLGLGGLAVSGTALVQAGELGPVAVAASVPAFLMTFNLLLLNEFPDEEADRAGGRKNLVILLGRRGAALVYALVALLVPVWILGSVARGVFPLWAAPAALPTLLLVPALLWAFTRPRTVVPLPALGANVMWNLATNVLLGGGLLLAALL